ncbi:MAG: type II secretion system F family protein, partial [bacterium]
GAANLPLPDLLSGMALDLPQKPLKKAVDQLSADISKGMSLKDAIERLPDYSGQQAMGMIRMILYSRAPSSTLFRLLQHQQARKELSRSFWVKLIYPILLLFFCSLIFGVMLRVVATQFAPIFRDFGISIPILTQFVLQLADTINQLGLAGVFMPLVLCTAMLLAASLAINGSLQRWLAASQFCHILAELMESDCSLAESLQICRMLSHGRLAMAADNMMDLALTGVNLPDAMEAQAAIPEGASDLVRWAQSTGGTGAEGLRVAASLYEARSRSQSRFLQSVFTVVAGIIVFWLILITVVSVFGPMLSLLGMLSG